MSEIRQQGTVARLREWARTETPTTTSVRGPFRIAALASLTVVTGAYLSTLYGIVAIVGGATGFLITAGGGLVLGVVLGATLRRRVAVGLAIGLLVVGLTGYVIALPPATRAALSVVDVVEDTIAMLTGFSALRLVEAGLWAMAVAPGPTFLVAFFTVRDEYAPAAGVAGMTLGFFVLTGDASTAVTLAGVLAAAAAVAFGTLARLEGGRDQLEVLAAVFAAVILASAVVSAVPGGGASPLRFGGGGVQNDLVSADDEIGVGGSIRLSPEVRFTVESEGPAYWRVAPFDRFTGSRWVQTGTGTSPIVNPLPQPPGERESLNQTFEAVAPMDALPAAATPYRVFGVDARIDQLGAMKPDTLLEEGDQYTVRSLRPTDDIASLQAAGTAYPPTIRDLYLQVPQSTPDGVKELADEVTATAANPYESAKAIERWLEANKEYSLDVPEPSDNLAGQFILEMEAGYCVYFATAMVTMLRSQDIPARYVVGYTSGQRVAEDKWVVRGLDSHAWVEVYFPEIGWVRFDPTPAEPRRAAEQERLDEARGAGSPNVDITESLNGTYVPTTTATPTVGTVTRQIENATVPPRFQEGTLGGNATVGNGTGNAATATTAIPAGPEDGGAGSGPPLTLPPIETMSLWAVLTIGLAAGARRSGLAERAYRELWMRVQPRTDDPQAAIEGAFDRALYALERRHGPRQSGETAREYLDRIGWDPTARTLLELRERARYAGEGTSSEADRARTLAADIVRRRRPGDSV